MSTSRNEITKPRVFDILGGLLLIVALPPFTYYIWICVRDFGGSLIAPAIGMLSAIPGPTVASIALLLGLGAGRARTVAVETHHV